jgi:hypothetical protein
MTEIEDKELVRLRLEAVGGTGQALARVLHERGWRTPIPIRALADDPEFKLSVKTGIAAGNSKVIFPKLWAIHEFQVREGIVLVQFDGMEVEQFIDLAGPHNFNWLEGFHSKNITVSSMLLQREIMGAPLPASAVARTREFVDTECREIVANIRNTTMFDDFFIRADAICVLCENMRTEGREVCELHWLVCAESGCTNGWTYGSRRSGFCQTHRQTCDDCGSEVRQLTNGKCGSCLKGKIDGYGHTHAEMWLGGPLPDEKYRGRTMQSGYYIGFELEIGTEDAFPNSVRDWAEEHMGDRGALECKEDSSVEGYEIASQPMTPDFFESLDWNNFFEKLNRDNPTPNGDDREPYRHGLHVHIGRIAFRHSMTAMAAFAYMIDLQDNLSRIGRRSPYHYCKKVEKRVSTAAVSPYGRATKQYSRLRGAGFYAERDAINFANEHTIEIRAFKSTRQAKHFTRAVRWVYLTAEYIRDLQERNLLSSPKHLTLSMMKRWMREHHPDKMVGLFPRGT